MCGINENEFCFDHLSESETDKTTKMQKENEMKTAPWMDDRAQMCVRAMPITTTTPKTTKIHETENVDVRETMVAMYTLTYIGERSSVENGKKNEAKKIERNKITNRLFY